MTLPTLEPLTATTLARKWKIDVDCSPLQDGSMYRRLMGQTEATFNPGTAGLQSDSDYDAGGYTSSTATTQEWGGTATVRRAPKRVTPTVYDAAQEFLRIAARKMGAENTVRIRAYEDNGANGPMTEAYEGYVAVAWANGGGGPDALSNATVTLTGQGAPTVIVHPAAATATPTVASVQPAVGADVPAAGGELVLVRGSRFLALTTLTVFGSVVAAADRVTVDDGTLVFKSPAHAAGTGDVTVTTPAGTSAVSAASKIVYV